MTDLKLELYCVRHGETVWNSEGRIQGCEDTLLSLRGREQIDALSERLRAEHFDALYTSDLQRAQQTAIAINRHHHLDMRIDQRLRERNFGVFQGLTLSEIEEREPVLYEQFMRRAPDFEIPEGQSWQQKHAEVTAFMNDILERHHNQRVVAITHGGSIYCMVQATLGLPLDRPVPMRCGNTSIAVFAYETGRWVLRRWGDQQHLGAGLQD